MRAAFTLGFGLVFAFAGCVADEPAPSPSTTVPAGNLVLPNFRPVQPNVTEEIRTLNGAPVWKQGEWWTYKVTDFTGGSYETTRIVAGEEGENYLVGMPADAFSDDLMVLHLPGFGEVRKSDLSFEVHDVRFAPLKFPLVEGDTWTTAFEGRSVKAKTFLLGEKQARVQMDGANDHINVTYDLETGEMVLHKDVNYATVEVTGHGYNWTGHVMVPHMHDLVFQHGRIGPLLNFQLQPVVNTDTVVVESTYDRTSFVLLAGNPFGTPTSGGYYHEKATGPAGKTYEMTFTPAEGKTIKFKTFYEENPGGTWKFEHLVAGAGFGGAEGIAYHTYIIALPEGRILPSTGEHKHGA